MEYTTSDKNEVIHNIVPDCFRSDNVDIWNDLKPLLAQESYGVGDYFRSILNISDKIREISYDSSKTMFRNVCCMRAYNLYNIVMSVEETRTNSNNTVDKRSIDFCFGFDPATKKELRIESIRKHQNVADSCNTVVIIHEDGPIIGDEIPCISFDITPARADVTIDGIKVYTDGDRIETKRGKHTIKITHADYITDSFDVNIGSSGLREIQRILQPRTGLVTVTTMDTRFNNASVLIDNVLAGNIPLQNYKLSVGGHHVRASGNSITYEANVIIAENKNFAIKITNDKSICDDYFDLSEHGVCDIDSIYGDIWMPNEAGYRPYASNGRWKSNLIQSSNECVNTWVSNDSWIARCYQTGRWVKHHGKWAWVRGYEVAPAWVKWRSHEGYVGWAPLTPDDTLGSINNSKGAWIFIKKEDLYRDNVYDNYYDREDTKIHLPESKIIGRTHKDKNGIPCYYLGPNTCEH